MCFMNGPRFTNTCPDILAECEVRHSGVFRAVEHLRSFEHFRASQQVNPEDHVFLLTRMWPKRRCVLTTNRLDERRQYGGRIEQSWAGAQMKWSRVQSRTKQTV